MFNCNRATIRQFRQIIAIWVMTCFLGTSIVPPTFAQTVFVSGIPLPAPGSMVTPSIAFHPPNITGIQLNPQDPLNFTFIIDRGDGHVQGSELEKETKKLINYFLAALTVPEDEMWVNLSPYEKDRIISDSLSKTEMGRDMLAQDYLLKQLTASLMYPEEKIGQEFWSRVHAKAKAKFGTTEIPTDTFNKVWIIPDKSVVYVNGSGAFVAESHLKVMLEEDYVALANQSANAEPRAPARGVELPNQQASAESLAPARDVATSSQHSAISDQQLTVESRKLTAISEDAKQIIREILIPEIERDINEGENFARLRQIFHAMILATWYKKNLRQGILGKVFTDQNKVAGIDLAEKDTKEQIYARYLEAFQKGVYNYIREDIDPTTQEMIPRKYFSGGLKLALSDMQVAEDSAMSSKLAEAGVRPHAEANLQLTLVGSDGSPIASPAKPTDAAMAANNLANLGTDEALPDALAAKTPAILVNRLIRALKENEPLRSSRDMYVLAELLLRAPEGETIAMKFNQTLPNDLDISRFTGEALVRWLYSIDAIEYVRGSSVPDTKPYRKPSLERKEAINSARKALISSLIDRYGANLQKIIQEVDPDSAQPLRSISTHLARDINESDELYLQYRKAWEEEIQKTIPQTLIELQKNLTRTQKSSGRMSLKKREELGKRLHRWMQELLAHEYTEKAGVQELLTVLISFKLLKNYLKDGSRKDVAEEFPLSAEHHLTKARSMLQWTARNLPRSSEIRKDGDPRDRYTTAEINDKFLGEDFREYLLQTMRSPDLRSKNRQLEHLAEAFRTLSKQPVRRVPRTSSPKKYEDIVSGLGLSKTRMMDLRARVTDSMKAKLAGITSSLLMLRTYLKNATGEESGEYLSVDLGGSNLRALWGKLQPGQEPEIKTIPSIALTEKQMNGSPEQLFDTIASQVKELLTSNDLDAAKPYSLGFTFSFPTTQTSLTQGTLDRWNKGWNIPEVVGKDVVKYLQDALDRNGLSNIRVRAILNDTVATQLSVPGATMGIILGTGFNISYYDPERQEIINSEAGGFGEIPEEFLTEEDKEVEAIEELDHKKERRIEKMISGGYLGEVFRLRLRNLQRDGQVFAGQELPILNTIEGVKTATISAIESVQTPEDIRRILIDAGITEQVSDEDALKVAAVAKAMSQRAGFLFASIVAGALDRADPGANRDHVLAIDGTLYERHPLMPQYIDTALEQLLGEKAKRVTFKFSKDASGKGGLIAAAVATGNVAQKISVSKYLVGVENPSEKTFTDVTEFLGLDERLLRLLNPDIQEDEITPGTALTTYQGELNGMDGIAEVFPGKKVLLFDNDQFMSWPVIDLSEAELKDIIEGKRPMPDRYKLPRNNYEMLFKFFQQGGVLVVVSGGDINNNFLRVADMFPPTYRKQILIAHNGGKQIFGFREETGQIYKTDVDFVQQMFKKEGIGSEQQVKIKEAWEEIINDTRDLFVLGEEITIINEDTGAQYTIPPVRIDRRYDQLGWQQGYPVQMTFEFDMRHDALKKAPLWARQEFDNLINDRLKGFNQKYRTANISLINTATGSHVLLGSLKQYLDYRYDTEPGFQYINGDNTPKRLTLRSIFGGGGGEGALDTGIGNAVDKGFAVSQLFNLGIIQKMLGIEVVRGDEILVGDDNPHNIVSMMNALREFVGDRVVPNVDRVAAVVTPKNYLEPKPTVFVKAGIADQVTIVNGAFGEKNEGIYLYAVADALRKGKTADAAMAVSTTGQVEIAQSAIDEIFATRTTSFYHLERLRSPFMEEMLSAAIEVMKQYRSDISEATLREELQYIIRDAISNSIDGFLQRRDESWLTGEQTRDNLILNYEIITQPDNTITIRLVDNGTPISRAERSETKAAKRAQGIRRLGRQGRDVATEMPQHLSKIDPKAAFKLIDRDDQSGTILEITIPIDPQSALKTERPQGPSPQQALSSDEIKKLNAEFPQFNWEKASEVSWKELVRFPEKEPAPQTRNQKNYYTNQVAVRKQLLQLTADLASGRLASSKEFVGRFRQIHRILIKGEGGDSEYTKITSYDEGNEQYPEDAAGNFWRGDETYGEQALTSIMKSLQKFISPEFSGSSKTEAIDFIARLYADMIYARNIFVYGNHSWQMNIVNMLLRLRGLEPVPNGSLDIFVKTNSDPGINAHAEMKKIIEQAQISDSAMAARMSREEFVNSELMKKGHPSILFHNAEHSWDVGDLTEVFLKILGMPELTISLARTIAELHDFDSLRGSNTPARVDATLDEMADDWNGFESLDGNEGSYLRRELGFQEAHYLITRAFLIRSEYPFTAESAAKYREALRKLKEINQEALQKILGIDSGRDPINVIMRAAAVFAVYADQGENTFNKDFETSVDRTQKLVQEFNAKTGREALNPQEFAANNFRDFLSLLGTEKSFEADNRIAAELGVGSLQIPLIEEFLRKIPQEYADQFRRNRVGYEKVQRDYDSTSNFDFARSAGLEDARNYRPSDAAMAAEADLGQEDRSQELLTKSTMEAINKNIDALGRYVQRLEKFINKPWNDFRLEFEAVTPMEDHLMTPNYIHLESLSNSNDTANGNEWSIHLTGYVFKYSWENGELVLSDPMLEIGGHMGRRMPSFWNRITGWEVERKPDTPVDAFFVPLELLRKRGYINSNTIQKIINAAKVGVLKTGGKSIPRIPAYRFTTKFKDLFDNNGELLPNIKVYGSFLKHSSGDIEIYQMANQAGYKGGAYIMNVAGKEEEIVFTPVGAPTIMEETMAIAGKWASIPEFLKRIVAIQKARGGRVHGVINQTHYVTSGGKSYEDLIREGGSKSLSDLDEIEKMLAPTKVPTGNIKIDAAMAGEAKPGGIDLNPANMQMQEEGRGIDFNLPDTWDNISPSAVIGIQPVIINITPVTNFLQLIRGETSPPTPAAKLSQL